MRLTRFNELNIATHTHNGVWELTPNHQIRYKSENTHEELQFKGSLVAAEPEALVFSVRRKQSDHKSSLNLFKLTGKWKLNLRNQIVFDVTRRNGETDSLTFKGGWQVGPNHEIVYSYNEESLKRKTKVARELVFSGFWDISEKHRLTYFVGGSTESVFRIRGAFQTHSILAKKGEIRYQAGLEVNGRRQSREIILFGKWLVSRNLALSFEIEYPRHEKRTITFGGQYALTEKSEISVELKSRDGKPLALELILTKDIFGKDGQAFARLISSLEETRLEAGMRVAW